MENAQHSIYVLFYLENIISHINTIQITESAEIVLLTALCVRRYLAAYILFVVRDAFHIPSKGNLSDLR